MNLAQCIDPDLARRLKKQRTKPAREKALELAAAKQRKLEKQLINRLTR